MGLAAFNNARRLKAERANKPSSVSDEQLAKVEPKAAMPSLCDRLNQAESGSDLADLPTIGKGAGDVIVENRPDSGYDSIEAVIAANEKVTKHPYTVDWEEVQAHFKTSLEAE